MLYDGPFVLNEVAAQPGDETWSIEIDGFVPHLDKVTRVLTPEMKGGDARGEQVATVDETLGLGLLLRNGTDAADGSGPRCAAAACGARARGGRDRLEGDRDGDRLRLGTRAVRQEDRHLPGDLARARRRVRCGRARALARVLGRVVRVGRRRAGRSRGRGGEVAGVRGGGARLRDDRSRRTAGSASRGSTRCIATTSGRSGSKGRSATAACTARRSPHRCCARNRRVERDRRGDLAPSRGARVGGVRVGASSRARRRRERVSSSSTSPTRKRSSAPRHRIERWTGWWRTRGSRSRRRSSTCRRMS